MWHMGLRLPWTWRIGPSNSSERAHVEEMLEQEEMPEDTENPFDMVVAKNDRTDAKLILKFLQHDRDELRPLVNNSAETRELETLTIHRRSLVDERVALGNRLMSLLKCYLPAVLALKPTDIPR